MSTLDVAVVGTGPGPDGDPSAVTYRSTEPTPSSMGYVHGEAYADHPDCSLVGCADLVAEHARRFAEAFGLSADRAYTDHAAMLAAVEPDVVSVCTPPTARPDIVV
ncbi:MAG: Gfo/Idh/MocA family protein, partial [Halobacteriaceae archaeon]